MKSSVWRRYSVVAVCLTLATACVALAEASSESTAHKKGKNSQSTQKYVDLLSKLFDKWDLNSDDYLDKEELAKAFRGPNAKPYDYKKDYPDNDAATDTSKDDSKDSTTTKKPNYTNYPDYTFLMNLDTDGDGQISRDEFMDWAKGYAVQLKDQAAQQKKVAALETRLQSASGKEARSIERQLRREQAKIDRMISQMNSAETAMGEHLRRR